MGGCATKPLVLKDETEEPKPVEEVPGVAEPDKAEKAGSGEEADGQKSLCNLINEKETEEAAAGAGEEDEKASTEEAESKPEVSQLHTEAAAAEEKQQ